MLSLLVVSTGLVAGFHRESWKHCERLGSQPTEHKPAKQCWYHCHDEARNRVHRKIEPYGTPCVGRPQLPLGFCWGSYCYQDRFGRRPPWTPPPSNAKPAGSKQAGKTNTTAGPSTSKPCKSPATTQSGRSAVNKTSTPYNGAPTKAPK